MLHTTCHIIMVGTFTGHVTHESCDGGCCDELTEHSRGHSGTPGCMAGPDPGVAHRVAKQGAALGTAMEMATGVVKKECVLRCGRAPPPPFQNTWGKLTSFRPCAARRYERAQ